MGQPENARSDHIETEKTPYQMTEGNEKVTENVKNEREKSPTLSETEIREMYQSGNPKNRLTSAERVSL